MLEALGISNFAESVYRALLAAPGRTVTELALTVDKPVKATRRAVTELEENGLVTRAPGRPVRLLAARPDTAVDLLVARRQSELTALQVNARALAAQMSGPRQPDELLEILVGRRAVGHRYTALVRNCERELLVIDRPPYAAPIEPAEEEVSTRLSDEVVVRGLYAPESLEPPGALEAVRRAIEKGEQSRMHPKLPMKLAIADRSVALLPLVLEDMLESAVVVRKCALLDALIVLFEMLWEQSSPVVPGPGAAPPDLGLLTLLAAGAKDETIARQLGISPRTVTRRVSELLDQLGARTRFHAGVMAARNGWLVD
ncbi:helix-turn-helix domain-containing protein [Actinophytocola oryzae]|uniref:Sugar-specific transcriptional regulator TrmB n=1 Tax=Actinophytocola oryzae TaxID=502181 RepID=A0A4R7V6C8_9PSEU|nr:helix-turn-helix domain-containing protein [Actinophytocola oryzae]TDV43575.1 sugar-specific transcriptional regulator TrmB [Actinophytocola oryzae]